MLGDYIRRPQWRVVVNLLQELGVGVDLVRHGNWLGESNEFHKRFFYLGLPAPNPRGTRNHPHEALRPAASLWLTRGSS